MRAWAASVEEVFREAAARWTLIAYFALSSLFILIFALAVNLDVVNGVLAFGGGKTQSARFLSRSRAIGRFSTQPKYGDGIEWKLEQDADFLRDA